MRKGHIFTSVFSISLLFALSLSLGSCNFLKEKKELLVPVQATEDGSWYFINAKGEKVGDQTWEFMPSISKDGVFTARVNDALTVYAWKGNEAKPIDSLENLVSVGVYNEGLLPVTPAMQRIRIVDKKGKVKFVLEPINGQEITRCSKSFKEGLLVITTSDNKAGVINDKGEVVIAPFYSEISDFNDGFALAVKYDYESDEGPTYYILDKEGNAKKINGNIGYPYEEGDGYGSLVSEFVGGVAYIHGSRQVSSDEYDYEPLTFKVTTAGQVTKTDGNEWVTPLEGGGSITYTYTDDESIGIWKDAEGKVIKKVTSTDGYMSDYGKYVTLSGDNNLTVFSDDGTTLTKIQGNVSGYWSGGDFGLFYVKYAEDYSEPANYFLLDPEGKAVEGAKYFGIGSEYMITQRDIEDESYDVSEVTSAYIDVAAASSKLASMVTGSVKGKDSYYLGESVATILSGENARYYPTSSNSFTIPTDSTFYLSSGPGFWINGTATSNESLTEATYQQYFEVHHYDEWGRAWGWNRTRQTGVKFNPRAKVIAFDLQLHTNHPSGQNLREAVVRRLKKDGYTITQQNTNYDELSNGYQNVIVYGNQDSCGVGAIVYQKDSWYYKSDDDKAALAAQLIY